MTLTSAMGGKRTLAALATVVSNRDFLVVYDYGMGGVWGFARAQSEAEILDAFPELNVVQDTSEWMTQEHERKVRLESGFTVGEASSYPEWLRTLVAERRS